MDGFRRLVDGARGENAVESVTPVATFAHFARIVGAVRRRLGRGDDGGPLCHRSAERIAGFLDNDGITGEVATLFPSVVLDLNPVREEFAAGPFFFRSADLFPPAFVTEMHGVGPATLETVFADRPPSAIVAGFNGFPVEWKPPMDFALVEYARRHHYRLFASGWTIKGYKNGQVWLRPK